MLVLVIYKVFHILINLSRLFYLAAPVKSYINVPFAIDSVIASSFFSHSLEERFFTRDSDQALLSCVFGSSALDVFLIDLAASLVLALGLVFCVYSLYKSIAFAAALGSLSFSYSADCIHFGCSATHSWNASSALISAKSGCSFSNSASAFCN